MASKRYATRKARMDRDPDYRAKVLRAQAESRRLATERRWQELVDQGSACNHQYPNGRHCWKSYSHTHDGGLVVVGPAK